LPAALCLYTLAARHFGGGTPPAMAAPSVQADMVIVDKPARTMRLVRQGAVIRTYRVSLGGSPAGHKAREGDERTPEGRYVIDWRNPHSSAYLSLHISYPAPADVARASAASQNPGGNIMIHGLINGWGFFGSLHRLWDWTDGCIAVTDAEMSEVWSLVPDGTPIQIDG
jgi:murein L,D-transpeptidase YafK